MTIDFKGNDSEVRYGNISNWNWWPRIVAVAKELDGMPSGARHRTGTMQFMAIEVLEGKGHTYRHDLESFFYVFVWMCIRYGYEGTGRQKLNKLMRPKTNILRG